MGWLSFWGPFPACLLSFLGPIPTGLLSFQGPVPMGWLSFLLANYLFLNWKDLPFFLLWFIQFMQFLLCAVWSCAAHHFKSCRCQGVGPDFSSGTHAGAFPLAMKQGKGRGASWHPEGHSLRASHSDGFINLDLWHFSQMWWDIKSLPLPLQLFAVKALLCEF